MRKWILWLCPLLFSCSQPSGRAPQSIEHNPSSQLQQDLYPDLHAFIIPSGVQIVLKNDRAFMPGEEKPTQETRNDLRELARHLHNYSYDRIRVEVHSDAIGREIKNLKLSQARSDHLAQILTEFGISRKKIEAHGFGGGKPVAENKKPSDRKKNRRVEIYVDLPGSSSARDVRDAL